MLISSPWGKEGLKMCFLYFRGCLTRMFGSNLWEMWGTLGRGHIFGWNMVVVIVYQVLSAKLIQSPKSILFPRGWMDPKLLVQHPWIHKTSSNLLHLISLTGIQFMTLLGHSTTTSAGIYNRRTTSSSSPSSPNRSITVKSGQIYCFVRTLHFSSISLLYICIYLWCRSKLLL